MGTRILHLNMEVFISMFTWPFQGEGAAVSIIKNKLPPDARFLGFKKINGKDVYVIIGSETWPGDEHSLLLPDPVFMIHGEHVNKNTKPSLDQLEKLAWSSKHG